MNTPRLGQSLLPTLSNIATPGYDRAAISPGILHIGVGAFHRAHQAVYTDDALQTGAHEWGIIGASLRSDTARTQLAPQDCLYTVSSLSGAGTQRRIIGALQGVITASSPGGYQRLLQALADPAIHVVTLTVTEKGYCHLSGELDQQHPDVQHDLNTDGPRFSLPGIVVAGLQARFNSGGAPITLLSCDNLAGNGNVLNQVLSAYAALTAPHLCPWIDSHVSCPSTMVDRIVPATTQTDRTHLAEDTGFVDDAMVCCEPFRQWVIEDRFAGPRPPWETAGALLVDDVSVYEHAKLRLLNGPHSATAYMGLLHGLEFVHEVMNNTTLSGFVRRLAQQEILPTVPPLPGLNLTDYSDSVFERFSNQAIAYPTRQVGTDGSQKLAQRLIPVVRERLQHGQAIDCLALVFAAWIEHLRDPAPDPLQEKLRLLYRQHHAPAQLVAAIDANTPVWAGLNGQADAFRTAVTHALTTLRQDGVLAAASTAA